MQAVLAGLLRSVGDSVMALSARQAEHRIVPVNEVPITSCKNFIFYVKWTLARASDP